MPLGSRRRSNGTTPYARSHASEASRTSDLARCGGAALDAAEEELSDNFRRLSKHQKRFGDIRPRNAMTKKGGASVRPMKMSRLDDLDRIQTLRSMLRVKHRSLLRQSLI